MTTTFGDERLVRDYFPVEVYAPNVCNIPTVCRVFLTTKRIIAWHVLPDREMRVLLDAPLVGDPIEPRRGTLPHGMSVTIASGLVHLNRARGCGCGSPLKALAAPVGW